MATKTGTALAESSPAPKVPETSVLVFCWIGIVIAAGTSITFNIHHDTSWLPNLMASNIGKWMLENNLTDYYSEEMNKDLREAAASVQGPAVDGQ